MTRFDGEHGDDEERWVNPGSTFNGQLLIIVHTFLLTGPSSALVRLISARPVGAVNASNTSTIKVEIHPSRTLAKVKR